MQKTTVRADLVAGLVAVSTTCGVTVPAAAQHTHGGDFELWVHDGHIEAGVGGEAGHLVAEGRLDEASFPNLADEPGFDSEIGAFPPGSGIGFDLHAALRVWDGDDFETIEPVYAMSVTKGDDLVTTPAVDDDVPGFVFGSADAGGRFHHHLRFFLDPYDAVNQVEGLWLLQFELWSTNPTIEPSEPLFVVFAAGTDAVNQQEDAVAWVEEHLIGGGCNPADLSEPHGLLDLADITVFISAFSAGEHDADLAEPHGTFDLADITAFVAAFTEGCP